MEQESPEKPNPYEAPADAGVHSPQLGAAQLLFVTAVTLLLTVARVAFGGQSLTDILAAALMAVIFFLFYVGKNWARWVLFASFGFTAYSLIPMLSVSLWYAPVALLIASAAYVTGFSRPLWKLLHAKRNGA